MSKNNTRKNTDDLSLKYNLISAILSARTQNEGLQLFRQTFHNDFLEFANSNDTLSNEAEMTLYLQNIERELSIIASCPELYKKNIIAIGGGFSAGKSEFISSFINSDLKLPTSVEPTTAIATYVMNSDKKQIIGYNNFGGAVNLMDIDKYLYSKLSHEFISDFKFNLKDILPFIVVATDIKFKNICFIDTPGYNPSNHDSDVKTSKEFLQEADSLIWIIGLDSNGTISNNDLNFLSDLDLKNKKLYVLLNKADLRSPSDLEDIIESVKESLDDYDISYEGLQTFSSFKPNINPFIIGKSLNKFLNEHDTPSKKYIDMFNKIKYVYQEYKNSILNKINEKKSIQKTIKSISLDMLENGFDDMESSIYTKLNDFKTIFDTQKEEKNLKILDQVADNFKESIKLIFGLKNFDIDLNDEIDEISEKVREYNGKYFPLRNSNQDPTSAKFKDRYEYEFIENDGLYFKEIPTDFSYMFYENEDFNDPDITYWDTSKVTNMFYMFNKASSFNQPLNFNTSNVTSMAGMFNEASSFNQPLDFNTSNVTDMAFMFRGASSFNQPLDFNTSNVTDMAFMFSGASSFNQPLDFDTSNVTNMTFMFSGATSFNQPLDFNTSNVTNMAFMFSGASSFNQPLDFDTSNVNDMEGIFD